MYYILNKNGDAAAVIDEYSGMTEKRVFAPSSSSFSSVELEMPIAASGTVAAGDWIHTHCSDYYIVRTSVSSEGGVFKLWGEEASALLAFAIIPFDTVMRGTPSELICKLIREYGASVLPSDISEISYSADGETEYDFTAHAGNLLDVIAELCVLGGLGLSIGLSESDRGKLTVSVEHMRDVRIGTNDAVILSEQYENIDDIISECDYSDYRNCAFVKGAADPDGKEQSVSVRNEELLLGERWIYIDEPIPISRCMVDGSFSPEAYAAALEEAGKLELMKHRPRISLDIELCEDAALKLKLGDLCSVRSDKLDILCEAVCTEKLMTNVGGVGVCRAKLYLNN